MSKQTSYDLELSRLLDEARKQRNEALHSLGERIPRSIRSDIEMSRTQIENKGLLKDIELKEKTLNILFRFLMIETVLIFVFALLQATKWLGFNMEEWSFKLLTTVTIMQITYMLQVAVKHLFPQKV